MKFKFNSRPHRGISTEQRCTLMEKKPRMQPLNAEARLSPANGTFQTYSSRRLVKSQHRFGTMRLERMQMAAMGAITHVH